jgi:SPP1 gp7 family putative phage head morphogenesis protein
MATINEELLDAAVDHQIDITRYGNGVVRRMLKLLNKVDPDLLAQLQAALERMPANSFTVQRLDDLLVSVRKLNGKAYEAMTAGLLLELEELTDYEAGYQQQLFTSMLPTQIQVAAVVPDQVYAAAMARPFQGELLSEWAAGIEAARMIRIRDAIRIGFVENQTIDQMVRRISGRRDHGYADGLLQIDRRHAEAVVRTAVSHTANFARESFFEQNAELIKGLRWTATLDSRTSPVCRARDGKVYPMNSGPRPPAHWNCRSTMTPVIKSWRELGFDMDEAPASTRASMDGQVPADMTYQQWLRKQSAARQDEILGVKKGLLFRDGGLELDRFVDRAGQEYNLTELRERNAAAFRKAGIE